MKKVHLIKNCVKFIFSTWLFQRLKWMVDPCTSWPRPAHEAPAKALVDQGQALRAELGTCDVGRVLHDSTQSVLHGHETNSSRQFKRAVARFGMAMILIWNKTIDSVVKSCFNVRLIHHLDRPFRWTLQSHTTTWLVYVQHDACMKHMIFKDSSFVHAKNICMLKDPLI